MGRVFNLRHQGSDATLVRRTFGPREPGSSFSYLQAAHCDSRDYQLVEGPQHRRKKIRIEVRKQTLSVIEVPDQEQSPDSKIARMSGVEAVAVCFEGQSRRLECFRRPAQVTRGESNLGLSDDAPGTGHGFSGTEGGRSPPQELLCSCEIAQLCHRNAAKSECRRILAQRDSLQGSE